MSPKWKDQIAIGSVYGQRGSKKNGHLGTQSTAPFPVMFQWYRVNGIRHDLPVVDRPLRILLLTKCADHGGIETWMLVSARSMLTAGHEVRFFFSRSGARLAEFEACATTHVGGPAELVGVCETWEPHIVHAPMQAFEAEVTIFASVPPRLVISSHGMVADRWHTGNCAVATAVSKHWASRFSQASGLPTETI